MLYNYRSFNYTKFYLSDFTENWSKCVYVCQNGTREIISQSDHPFQSYDQKFKCSIYVHYWMRPIRFRGKILAPSDIEFDCVMCRPWMFSSICPGENSSCITSIQ